LKDSDPSILKAIVVLGREVIALRGMQAGQSDATKADLVRQIKQRVAAQLYLLEQLSPSREAKELLDVQKAIWRARDATDPAMKPKPMPASAEQWDQALDEVRGWCGLS